ncbi:HAD-IIB family hydrolase [Bacillus sp. N9]
MFKLSVIGTEDELDRVENLIQPAVSRLHVIRSGEGAIDIVSPQASKGAALKWLADYYQVEREDTIAFGNYYNDISMLEYAGTGIAMQNAPDDVKRSADIVSYSNEEHGVAKYLEQHVLRKVTM